MRIIVYMFDLIILFLLNINDIKIISSVVVVKSVV